MMADHGELFLNAFTRVAATEWADYTKSSDWAEQMRVSHPSTGGREMRETADGEYSLLWTV